MGVALEESNNPRGPNVFAPPPPVEKDEAPAPYVRATQILSSQQRPYTEPAYGIKRPFPAEAAGIEVNDKLLSVNEIPVSSIKELMREVSLIGPARVVLVLIEREGKKMCLPLLLTHNPTRDGITPAPPPPVDLEKELEQPSPLEGPAHAQATVPTGPAAHSNGKQN